MSIASPLVWILNASANLVLRVFGVRAGFERHLTDEDIAGVLIEGEKSGLIHAAEREMIEDVLDLADRGGDLVRNMISVAERS